MLSSPLLISFKFYKFRKKIWGVPKEAIFATCPSFSGQRGGQKRFTHILLHSEKCLQHLVVIWAAAVFHMNCMSLTILRKDGSQPLKKGNRYLLSFAPRMMTKNASFYSTNIRNNYHFVLTKHNADKLWVKDSRLVLMYQARRVLYGQLSNEYFDVSKIHTLHCAPLWHCVFENSVVFWSMHYYASNAAVSSMQSN